MKTLQETIYRCDHCNRPMFGKGAMSRHEKYCKENPNNDHKCFDFCKHLKRTVFIDSDDYENYEKRTDMECVKLKKFMYSYKFEKNYNKPVNALDGLERMPLECEHHCYMDGYVKY